MEEGDEGLEEALGLKTPQENSRIITGAHMDSQRACLHGTDLASLHICMYVTVVYLGILGLLTVGTGDIYDSVTCFSDPFFLLVCFIQP